jgi:hypothetical protein
VCQFLTTLNLSSTHIDRVTTISHNCFSQHSVSHNTQSLTTVSHNTQSLSQYTIAHPLTTMSHNTQSLTTVARFHIRQSFTKHSQQSLPAPSLPLPLPLGPTRNLLRCGSFTRTLLAAVPLSNTRVRYTTNNTRMSA